VAGRPKVPIDAEQVEKLSRWGHTMQEIADFFGCDVSVISRRFRNEYIRARSSWKMSLRRAQTIRAVKDRSDSMLIHLGKVYLGQETKGAPADELDEPVSSDASGNSVDP
jgi:hypothetical protein